MPEVCLTRHGAGEANAHRIVALFLEALENDEA